MDIIDITLLSLLRIKNYSLGDISIKISSHTLSEIRRAIFGLILLGLITAKREKAGPNIEVAFAEQQPTAAGTESNKSLLQKLRHGYNRYNITITLKDQKLFIGRYIDKNKQLYPE